jgi:adenosylcobinamide-phosphate synthase
MAGALRVRLGGENTYAGEPVAAPLLGAEFDPPMLLHANRALRLITVVSLLSAAAALVFQSLNRLRKNSLF